MQIHHNDVFTQVKHKKCVRRPTRLLASNIYFNWKQLTNEAFH